jgi:hypothetical protein
MLTTFGLTVFSDLVLAVNAGHVGRAVVHETDGRCGNG